MLLTMLDIFYLWATMVSFERIKTMIEKPKKIEVPDGVLTYSSEIVGHKDDGVPLFECHYGVHDIIKTVVPLVENQENLEGENRVPGLILFVEPGSIKIYVKGQDMDVGKINRIIECAVDFFNTVANTEMLKRIEMLVEQVRTNLLTGVTKLEKDRDRDGNVTAITVDDRHLQVLATPVVEALGPQVSTMFERAGVESARRDELIENLQALGVTLISCAALDPVHNSFPIAIMGRKSKRTA